MTDTNYYQNEDNPDMSNPDTALDMYQSQAAALQTVLEDAYNTVVTSSQKLGEIHEFAVKNNQTELAQKAIDAYAQATKLHELIQHQDAARRGAEAVIEAVTTQRDEVLSELNRLLEGIDDVNETAHPKLEQFAEAIRDDQREVDDELAYEYMEEVTYDNMTEGIAVALSNCGIESTRTQFYAGQLMQIFTSPYVDFDEKQAAIIRQLCATFELPDYLVKREQRELDIRLEQQRAVFDDEPADDEEAFDVDD